MSRCAGGDRTGAARQRYELIRYVSSAGITSTVFIVANFGNKRKNFKTFTAKIENTHYNICR